MSILPRPEKSPRRRPRRLPLGATGHRISYERRIRLWLTALAAPAILLAAFLTYNRTNSITLALGFGVGLAAFWAIAAVYFFEQLVRPLQTLANVVASLREDDFSFRARGARRGDSLGDLALEINALAGTLQNQRSAARDALTLVERVMTAMQSPVFAFDPAGHLRLLNSAADLDLSTLLHIADQGLYSYSGVSTSQSPNPVRWSVRRTTFRLHGVSHTLLVLSDVAAALREEERLAWQRLIRVLSHEINNSLTPIKSLAGSLRSRLPINAADDPAEDFRRGLTVIEERAASLNRFLQAYQQLTRLPPPQLQRLSLGRLLEQVIPIETRLPIELQPGLPVHLLGDPDQLQQLLINLLRNAVEAALSPDAAIALDPHVTVTWSSTPSQIILHIRDNGPGLTNPANLFVPFYTTKPEGSGIGLGLAQQIATAHKGSVTLFNNDAAPGCTAELRLPAESV